MVNEALNRGWAVALTDLEGLGTPERHTYMVGESQGHAVLDVLRAARNLPGSDVRADAPVGLAGYSQGAAAVAWAGEQQRDYAPELQVKGIAAGGVPSDLLSVYRALDGGPSSGLVVATALGMDAAYPELDLDSYLTDAGRTQVRAAENMCLVDLLAFAGHRFASYTTTDPLTSPAWQARLQENRTGQRAPGAPVLVWRAQDDTVIPAALATQLTQDYCAQGATVSVGTGTGEHMLGFVGFGSVFGPYLADRFAGVPATSAC
jgi:pimeloyl-ACP methyl ester carboxylesterase